MTTLDEVRNYVLKEILSGEDPTALHDEDDLIAGGIIDSLGLVQLILFLQQMYNIEVSQEQLVADHFRSIRSIAAFIDQVVAPPSGAATYE